MSGKINPQSALITVGFLVGAYLVYRITGAASETIDKVVDSFTSTGENLGERVFDFFHPDPVGETTFYTVEFPGPIGDGQRHSVPARSVNADGIFIQGPSWGDGKPVPVQMRRRWRIMIGRESGLKVARPA